MIKYLSLFSGIGAPESALEELKIDFELVGFSEIDKYAAKSYCAVHDIDEALNLGDITKINIDKLPKEIDLITHGSPCQDYSIAGKQAGGDEGTGTRSSLMWNTVEIVKHCKPKVIIWENVKNVLSPKHRHNYEKYLNDMSEMGYMNYAKVLNAKDYGIPQNRERIFVVSIRKDVDKGFEFPQKQELKLRLKDVLEKEVNEKYYLPQKKVELFLKQGNVNPSGKGISGRVNTKDVTNTITANNGGGQKILINQLGLLDIKGNEQVRRVYGTDGISPTLNTMQGGNRQPKILETPCIAASRGRNPYNPSDRTPGAPTKQRLEPNTKGLSNTLTTVQKDNYILEPKLIKIGQISSKGSQVGTHGYAIGNILDSLRIRKLTPRECWRLMGFSDEQFEKAAKVCSDTQLYKQAGNSIVINVLVEIFKNLKYLFK